MLNCMVNLQLFYQIEPKLA